MKIYLDEYGRRIEDPAYTPPPGSFVYSTRRGDFVFPTEGKILTIAAEKEGDRDVPAQGRHVG